MKRAVLVASALLLAGCGPLQGVLGRSVTPEAAKPTQPVPSACRFVQGFGDVRAAYAEMVGACLEDERSDPATGDTHQRTSKGLLVWRRSDGLIAFTDGARTWVRAPDGGVYQRANDERFVWEAPPPAATGTPHPAPRVVTPGPALTPGPTPTPPTGRLVDPTRLAQVAPPLTPTAPRSFEPPVPLPTEPPKP